MNISGIQLLRDEFVDDVIRITKRTGINKKLLEFEITESVLLNNFDLINEKLKRIKEVGITISLDDFGTGFSSLSRLRDLNIDAVKIDKYFIDKLAQIRKDELISSDIISMSHKLGLTVVAEGVEDIKQKEYLQKHNCDILQGYLISKPLNEDEAINFLKDFAKRETPQTN